MTESGVSVHRVSIPYYVPTTENNYLETRHFPRMFAEDAAGHLFPRGGMWTMSLSSGCPPTIIMSQE